MSYADKRVSLTANVASGSSAAASAALATFILPADRRCELYNFRAFVKTANAGATFLRFTNSAGTAIASVPVSAVAAGSVQEASECASGPVEFITSAGCNGDDTVVHIIPSAQLLAFAGSVQADFSYPRAK